MAEGSPQIDRTAFFPVSLDVRGKRCLVVGGGPIAARKVRALCECGADVTVIALELSPELAACGPITVEQRAYRSGEVAGYQLVLTATGHPDVDGAVHADAEAAGIWVNSADDLEHCTFILPAVHRDGPVTVAVSTGGASPALASWLRARLAAEVDGAGALAALLSEARERVKASGAATESVDWAGLLNGPLPVLVREGRHVEARALIDVALAPR